MSKDVKEMTFEESLKALVELVDLLENGGLDLDRSLDIYENAVKLRDHCRSILEKSERRVQKIMETTEGIRKEDI
ncbi:MAG: exodeoxyribonuclease VII small subunit [Methanomassiliicoccaceae archaeon]|jgi:exodeoxyribonuclease VII small subunit|nr:exodeoxyribonuclease VII small subunit [Methanomassiliicoccaceae archaeon]